MLYMVLTKEKTATFRGTPAFVKMGSRLLKNLYIQVYAQARGKAIEELIADFEECSKEWGSTLPSEIQEEISQRECIVFSPDSDCGLFPLEGLSLDGEPLCLSKMVTRTTSMHLLKRIPCRKPFGSSLVVGNPWPLCEKGSLMYSSPSVGGRAGLTDIGPLTYLEGAETEVDTLAGVLPGVTVLKGLQATADTFLDELSHHSIVHLAGHGGFGRVLFFSSSKTRVPPEFEPEEFSTLRKAWRLSHGKTVYMMDEWDFVTDRDILTTQLAKGAFVFLNACETGKHKYAGGGHFQGLAQAFLKSGASNVISSLVPLFDQPSTDFAVSFYTALRSLSVVTALKDTRRRIRKKYRAQIYWLPYIHYGSPEHV